MTCAYCPRPFRNGWILLRFRKLRRWTCCLWMWLIASLRSSKVVTPKSLISSGERRLRKAESTREKAESSDSGIFGRSYNVEHDIIERKVSNCVVWWACIFGAGLANSPDCRFGWGCVQPNLRHEATSRPYKSRVMWARVALQGWEAFLGQWIALLD